MTPVVIKIGGTLVRRALSEDLLWNAVARIRERLPVVIVHGGGSYTTDVSRRLGHEPQIVNGRRVTSDLDLEVFKWTVRGSVNAELVAAASRHQLPGVGISGADGSLVEVRKREPWRVDGQLVDFGWVGDVVRVNIELLSVLCERDFIPIVAPLCLGIDGYLYNVNADTVAAAVAAQLNAAELLLVTDSGGVRRHPESAESTFGHIDRTLFEEGLSSGWIRAGMRVKLEVAFAALQSGIPNVYILSIEDLQQRRSGTRIVPSAAEPAEDGPAGPD